MRRTAIAVMLAFSSVAPAPAAVQHKAARHRFAAVVNSYSGAVNKASFDRFDDVMWKNVDKVIELKVQFESKDGSGFTAYASNDRLVLSGKRDGRDSEVVVDGPVGTTMDMFALDGFYLVKNGGMHAQGALSIGLVPVPEASIRLNPHIRIIRHQF